MKVSLVVAQGVHAGKTIPITSPQFLIGRDPQCNLRPASSAISKQHCGIFVRGGKVFVQDYGSTNGTSINGEPVTGEREAGNNDQLKIGPLEFVLKIEAGAAPTVKATLPKAGAIGATTAAAGAVTVPTKLAPPAAASAEEEPDAAAAMLLAMDESGADEPVAEIPEGSTATGLPAVPGAAPTQGDKAKQEKGATSKAAADLLSKYMKRPRT